MEVKKKDKILYPRKYQDTEVIIHEDQILDTVEVIRKRLFDDIRHPAFSVLS